MLPTREIARCIQTGLRNFFLGANVASLRFWSKPREAYLYWNACLFLSGAMGAAGLQRKHVWEVFRDSEREPNLHFPELKDSWIGDDPSYVADLVNLGILCQAVRPRAVFEIGTSTGYSSLFLAANTPPDAQIWTLDLPKPDTVTHGALTVYDRLIVKGCHEVEPCFVGHALGRKIRRVYGDSANFDFLPYRRSVDLFFVDGAHTYEYVRIDTINALRCCRPGGVIVWHDYGRSGLSEDVTEWLEQVNRIVPVYAAHGSSLAYMSCDFDCEALARRLGGHDPYAAENDHRGPQSIASGDRAVRSRS